MEHISFDLLIKADSGNILESDAQLDWFQGVAASDPSNAFAEALASLDRGPDVCAHLTQIHSAQVLEAMPGNCGEGDGLVTRRPGLALAVVTADCLPVVLVGADRLAVAHAGWRGLVAGVLPRAVNLLGAAPETLVAWIGPAIGPCCYEVGEEVARSVAGTLEAPWRDRVVSRETERPHLDLPATASLQLRALGVTQVTELGLCTSCRANQLWSYRREGEAAGRNFTLAWLA